MTRVIYLNQCLRSLEVTNIIQKDIHMDTYPCPTSHLKLEFSSFEESTIIITSQNIIKKLVAMDLYLLAPCQHRFMVAY